MRPDQSYRDSLDKQCEALLDNPLAVYMVYTLEQGDERLVALLVDASRFCWLHTASFSVAQREKHHDLFRATYLTFGT